MPSPFPGMDPFIEGQVWSDFHHRLIVGVADLLTPQALPRYSVRVEVTLYVQSGAEENGSTVIVPDALLTTAADARPRGSADPAAATAVAIAPVLLPVAMPQERRHVYLTIRERESDRIVTVIEVLSPKNKRAGDEGRRRYLRKRDRVLFSAAHMVEIDLLRGGARLPMARPLPPGDYYAFVHREEVRPTTEVYAWDLRHPLPTIPVPLADGDADLSLDLQACFTAVYDHAAYAHTLQYGRTVEPAVSEEDSVWVKQVLAARK